MPFHACGQIAKSIGFFAPPERIGVADLAVAALNAEDGIGADLKDAIHPDLEGAAAATSSAAGRAPTAVPAIATSAAIPAVPAINKDGQPSRTDVSAETAGAATTTTGTAATATAAATTTTATATATTGNQVLTDWGVQTGRAGNSALPRGAVLEVTVKSWPTIPTIATNPRVRQTCWPPGVGRGAPRSAWATGQCGTRVSPHFSPE
ncbi:MAG: hypothetical protein JNM56_13750 [Planctomycetia bacterium]|nr:hypothetical protein [Planctomycetia bacterium]